MPDDARRSADRNNEMPTVRANKASAMRWAVGIAVLFIVGVIVWWVSGIPRGESPEIVPQNQQQQSQPQDGNQPPAVIPRDDTTPDEPIPVQPSQNPY